jgi:hypothetical protein
LIVSVIHKDVSADAKAFADKFMDITKDASLPLYTDLTTQIMMLRLSIQLKIPLSDLYVMAFEMGLADKLKN